MNAKLEERLRKLSWDDIRDWVVDRTAQRDWQYRDKVGEIVALDNCLAAKVRGTIALDMGKMPKGFSGGNEGGKTPCSCS